MKYLILLLVFIPFQLLAKYSHESEISSVVSGGNSDLETYLLRTTNEFTERILTYRVSGHYTYGEAAGEVSVRDWDINFRLEKMFTHHFGIYFAELTEGYRFQGIKARYNTDGGFKYFFIRRETTNLFSEIGYRYTFEDRYFPEENQYENKGRLYSEFNRQPSQNYSYRFWAEYLPNFTNTDDYIVSLEASFTSILTSLFSLKFSYRGTYDDEPAIPGNDTYDYTYTTALVAKF